MKREEVRFGNYIFSEISNIRMDKGIIQLDSSSLMYLFDVDDSWEFIKPIPLTEEYLLKFGFVKKDEEFQDNLLDTFMYHKDDIVNIEFSDKHGQLYWHENYSSIYHTEIYYVHQLQNLYNALTNSELTIK